jgi:acyl-CoA synthetase (AMP-forming)/AMP-acid ligase II
MTHPTVFAQTMPDKAAVIMAESGVVVTYAELEARSNRTAHLLRSLGLKRGDCVAAMLDNGPEMFDLAWAAQRAGLHFTAISTRLTPGEADYIVRDSGAGAFFASPRIGPVVDELASGLGDLPLFMSAPAHPPFAAWEEAMAAFPDTPIADQSPGELMLYSSGTTGRPKGVRRALSDGGILDLPVMVKLLTDVYGATAESVYLCPAPLYHAAPLGWTMMCHRLGMTVVVMEKFDAEAVLRFVEKYGVTHGQFVPTHFTRMLKLPEEVRGRYDLSSLAAVVHAAAPCPIPVKEAMMEWWGPILHEYYAATEGNGFTAIGPEEWMRKKGSVGRAMGCQIHACDEAGDPLPANRTGKIFFAGGARFEYHNDPAKTAETFNKHGWSTLGDVGHLDEDGYVFLTDRATFMIISGGVNVYPQEIENLLVTHPAVMDVAVIGAPDEEMGEKVVAVVQPLDPGAAGPELAEELRAFCRASLSGVKVPRQFDFTDELPRHPTGKLYKRLLRDRYWGKAPAST